MPTIPRVAECVHHVPTGVANEAAATSGFIKRQRELDGASFARALVFRMDVRSRSYLRSARSGGRFARCLDRRSWVGQALRRARAGGARRRGWREGVVSGEPAAVEILGRFDGVYVYEGSVVSLPGALREQWPGFLGGNGPAAVGASALRRSG